MCNNDSILPPPSDKSSAITALTGKKKQTEKVADALFSCGHHGKANKLAGCADTVFKNREGRIIGGWFCHDPICPVCCWRRQIKIHAELSQILDYIGTEYYDFYLLTLTYPNCAEDNLLQTTDDIYEAFNRLQRRVIWSAAFIGCLWTYEISYSQKSHFHPHIHAVCVSERGAAVDETQLFEAWRDCCGFDLVKYDFNLKKIKPTEKKPSQTESLMNTIDYVAKGVLGRNEEIDKLLNLDKRISGEALDAIGKAVEGRHRFGFTGLLKRKRCALHMAKDEDYLNVNDIETLKRSEAGREIFRCKWDAVSKRYGFTVV